MSDKERELKPCPFCGHIGLEFREGSTFRWIIASCCGCGASRGETCIQTLGQGTKDEWMADAQADAIAEWNTRAALGASDDLTAAYMSGRYDGRKLASAQELSDEQIIACLDERAPTRTHHGAAVFEYRLFALVDFARRVLATNAQGGSHG